MANISIYSEELESDGKMWRPSHGLRDNSKARTQSQGLKKMQGMENTKLNVAKEGSKILIY